MIWCHVIDIWLAPFYISRIGIAYGFIADFSEKENAMSSKSQSLRQRQRTNLFHAYRARGHKNNNLWLVYSVKMDRDFILPSDRQLIHWIYYLETNPLVKSFDLLPEAIISVDATEARGTELDATVILQNGEEEWHEVKSGDDEIAPGKSQLLAQASAATKAAVKYKTFSDKDLKPHVPLGLRWLKAIAYAAALRNQSHNQEAFALHSVVKNLESGNIFQLVNALEEFDRAILQGLIVRFAISNHIALDLTKGSFGMSSRWHLTEI